MMKRFVGVALVATLVAVVEGGTRLRADVTDDQSANALKGSWDIVVTTTPNPPFAAPFRILRTVSADGVVDAYAFPPVTPTPGALVNSSGHGSWQRTGRFQFTSVVKYFQLNPANFFGVLDSIGTLRENITIAPDGNSYTSVFWTEIAQPDGTVIIQNNGQTTAQRIR